MHAFAGELQAASNVRSSLGRRDRTHPAALSLGRRDRTHPTALRLGLSGPAALRRRLPPKSNRARSPPTVTLSVASAALRLPALLTSSFGSRYLRPRCARLSSARSAVAAARRGHGKLVTRRQTDPSRRPPPLCAAGFRQTTQPAACARPDAAGMSVRYLCLIHLISSIFPMQRPQKA